MRVLVCGGRYFGLITRGTVRYTPAWHVEFKRAAAEKVLLVRTLDNLQPKPTVIIHGKASGADSFADQWARWRKIPALPFKANWYPNGRNGGLDRSAGPARNQRMLDDGKPDLVVAFPGGKGTADMVVRAKRAGVQVIEVPA